MYKLWSVNTDMSPLAVQQHVNALRIPFVPAVGRGWLNIFCLHLGRLHSQLSAYIPYTCHEA